MTLPLSPAELEQLRFRANAEQERRQRAGEWQSGAAAHVEYQSRPVDWIVDKLGIPENTIRWSVNPEYKDHEWDGDVDPLVRALDLVARGESVAVSSATTTGKTFTLGACGTLYFLACFQDSIVLSLAPKQDQLLLNMWKEIGRLWPRFKKHFPNADLLTGKLRMRDGEGEKELWAATAFGAGLGADEELAQRLKGFHQAKMLWIIEEMPGVEQAMINTIVKTATAEFNPILGMGNPEHQHDTLSQFGKREWVTPIRISALDFPNVVCDREIIPGGRSRASIQRDLADANGNELDPIYLSQVRGIAPAQSQRALIQWSWLEAAAARMNDPAFRSGPLALGVDVADSPTGDKSAISRWQGPCCTEVTPFSAEDASEVGRIVAREIRDPNNPINPKYVGIDAVGVGASAVNELKRLGIRIRRISGAMRAVPLLDVEGKWVDRHVGEDGKLRADGPSVIEAERYANLRAAVFWRLREDLRLGRIALPKDPLLWEELTAIQFEEPNGKITIEKKELLKPRIGRSPDRADAVAYGNWARPRMPERVAVVSARAADEGPRDTGLEKLLAQHDKQRKRNEAQLRRVLKLHGKRN